MYISRVPLNGARRSAMEVISSPYKMHAAVEASFPPLLDDAPDESDGGSTGRILWRIDPIPNKGRSVWLYVVSPKKPDFSHLCEQAGWPQEGRWETKDYEPLLDRICNGQFWRFRLKANPVRKVLVNKSQRGTTDVVGTIQGHVTADQQVSWLFARAHANGFGIAANAEGDSLVSVSERCKFSFAHAGSKVTLSTAVFDGVLEVTDADAFRNTLRQGIGRAKAFGCGLLTISSVEGLSQGEAS